jgi:hypothetical protein
VAHRRLPWPRLNIRDGEWGEVGNSRHQQDPPSIEQSQSSTAYLLAAAHLIEAHRKRENQCVVLPRLNFDPVRVPDAEPALRHLGDLLAVPLELELMVDDVAFASRSCPSSISIE